MQACGATRARRCRRPLAQPAAACCCSWRARQPPPARRTCRRATPAPALGKRRNIFRMRSWLPVSSRRSAVGGAGRQAADQDQNEGREEGDKWAGGQPQQALKAAASTRTCFVQHKKLDLIRGQLAALNKVHHAAWRLEAGALLQRCKTASGARGAAAVRLPRFHTPPSPAPPTKGPPGVPTTMSTPSPSARSCACGLVPPMSSALRRPGADRCLPNRVTLSCVCSARSLRGGEGVAGGSLRPEMHQAHAWHQARPAQADLGPPNHASPTISPARSHLAGSRMMASGLRSVPATPSALSAACQLAVLAGGAAARPTNPGGGPCLKGAAPKFTASSAFFRQMAGYSAWPCRCCVGVAGCRRMA